MLILENYCNFCCYYSCNDYLLWKKMDVIPFDNYSIEIDLIEDCLFFWKNKIALFLAIFDIKLILKKNSYTYSIVIHFNFYYYFISRNIIKNFYIFYKFNHINIKI